MNKIPKLFVFGIFILAVSTISAQTSCGTVTDSDGNTYKTVQIGSQCWMAENLRSVHYSDGTEIYSGNERYYYSPYGDNNNVKYYGYLYNWKAVMRNSASSNSNPSGVQGICPNGWHVPSDAEWTELTDYIGRQSKFVCGSKNANIAKALASNKDWIVSDDFCAIGNDESANNATGFDARPAGYHYGDFCKSGKFAEFWSSTEVFDEHKWNVWGLKLSYNFAVVKRSDNLLKANAFSVRCVKN